MKNIPKLAKLAKLAVSILICQSAGFIGSIFTAPSIKTWYTTLQKPSFNPPNWLFSPVWITLFLLMGISLYLVWGSKAETERSKKNKQIALVIFFIHLALNILWSIIFFGLKLPSIAFFEIIILWAFILLTILKFSKISRTAAYLLLPYIAWVSFATILNFFLWILNI